MTDVPPSRLGACPSSETLSAFADGTLAVAPRAAVATHLATCFLCRAVAVGMAKARGKTPEAAGIPARDGTPGPAPAARSDGPASAAPAPTAPRSRSVVPRLVVLAVVLAVGAALFVTVRGCAGGGGAGGANDGDAVLAAVAKDLAATSPDLFAGFAPLGAAERAAAQASVRDGEIEVHGPTEVVLTGRPRFAWAQSGRVRNYDLVLKGADGKPAWKKRIEGFTAPFPADEAPLAPGTAWTWEVAGKRSTGTVRGVRTFRVASDDERRRFEAAVAIARARPATDRPDLVVAHLAARAGFLEEAEAAAAADTRAHPGDRAAAQTLAYVRARLGIVPAAR